MTFERLPSKILNFTPTTPLVTRQNTPNISPHSELKDILSLHDMGLLFRSSWSPFFRFQSET